MDISFVNRVKERGQLGNLLQTNVSANRAIFICGKSGIGKTALVDNVVEKINNKTGLLEIKQDKALKRVDTIS